MALPNSPYAGTNHGAAPQTARPNTGAQLGVSTIHRSVGNNIKSGYHLPFGAGYLGTQMTLANGVAVATHTYLYKGKVTKVSIPVKTTAHRGGVVTPIKKAPQTVMGF